VVTGDGHRLADERLDRADLAGYPLAGDLARGVDLLDGLRGQEAAKALGRRHNASLIIWGADTGARLEVNFLNLKEPDFAAAEATINETERTQLARPDAYTQFIINDLPNQFSFLTLFAVGQSFYVQGQFDTAIILIQEAVNLVSQFETLPEAFELGAAYLRLGYLHQATNQPQQAITNYN